MYGGASGDSDQHIRVCVLIPVLFLHESQIPVNNLLTEEKSGCNSH